MVGKWSRRSSHTENPLHPTHKTHCTQSPKPPLPLQIRDSTTRTFRPTQLRILDLNAWKRLFKAHVLVRQLFIQTHSVTLIEGHKLVTLTGQGGLVLDEVAPLGGSEEERVPPQPFPITTKHERAQLDATQTYFEDWFRLGTGLAKMLFAGRSAGQECGSLRAIPLTTDNDIHITWFHGNFPEEAI